MLMSAPPPCKKRCTQTRAQTCTLPPVIAALGARELSIRQKLQEQCPPRPDRYLALQCMHTQGEGRAGVAVGRAGRGALLGPWPAMHCCAAMAMAPQFPLVGGSSADRAVIRSHSHELLLLLHSGCCLPTVWVGEGGALPASIIMVCHWAVGALQHLPPATSSALQQTLHAAAL